MSWKSGLHLTDLEPDTRIEVTCRKCGATRQAIAGELMRREDLDQSRLDEVERRMRCKLRRCGGQVRIALSHNRLVEGFGRGLA